MTSTDPTLPNLFCVGAQKAGTSSLYESFRSSGQVGFGGEKEIHFFDVPDNLRQGAKWLKEKFAGTSGCQYRADFTPNYLLFEHVPAAIKSVCGEQVKIIILLRHPVDRAFSQFNFHRYMGVEMNADFETVVRNEPVTKTAREFVDWATPAYYFSRSLYFEQVKRYLDTFGQRNCLVLFFEDLFGPECEASRDSINAFLNVEFEWEVIGAHSNETKVHQLPRLINVLRKSGSVGWLKKIMPLKIYQKMRNGLVGISSAKPATLDPKLREVLYREYFREDTKSLCNLIGIEKSPWE